MSNFWWTMLEINLMLIVLWGTFKGLQRFLSFGQQRISLLAIPMLAVTVVVGKQWIPASADWKLELPVVQLNTVVVTPSGAAVITPADSLFSLENVYWISVAVAMIWLAIRLTRIVSMFLSAQQQRERGCRVVQISGRDSFSFFRWIQLQPELSGEDREIVLQHELIHVRKGHTFDLLFLEIVQCFYWFNPVVRLLKQDLVHVHEFEVDQIMYNRYRAHYMEFLLSYALGTSSSSYVLTHQFLAKLTLIKRIKTMKNTAKKRWLLALIVPVVAGAFILVSWTTQEAKKIAPQKQEVSGPVEEVTEAQMRNEKPAVVAEEAVKTEKQLEFVEPKLVYEDKMTEELPEISTKSVSWSKSMDDGRQAEFKGGMEALTNYLIKSIRYPEAAAKNNVSGKVIVGFVVTESGKITKVKVLKGVNSELDAEAVRVVSAMPDWNPAVKEGKKVSSEMQLPIAFQL